jgi:hypothetical protein
MRVGWTHSTPAKIISPDSRSNSGRDRHPYRANLLHRRPLGFSISLIAAGGLIRAEVLGPPGYRENAVVGDSGPDSATPKNASTSVSVTKSSAQELHFVHHLHANGSFAVTDFFWDRVLGTYRNPDIDGR